MTLEEFRHLAPGDIVRHKAASESVVVTANYGSHVAAVRSVEMTNPEEWELVQKRLPQPARIP